jgi:gliding motility-associated-like protein
MKILRAIIFGLMLTSVQAFAQTSVTVPNVFSPDGDGVNDRFTISSSGYDALTCAIYSRHGEVIYRFEGLGGSWDGHSHAGTKVSPGVYFVFVELTDSSGNIETRQGTLQVVYL